MTYKGTHPRTTEDLVVAIERLAVAIQLLTEALRAAVSTEFGE